MDTTGYGRKQLVYSFLCTAADALDVIVSVLYPEKQPEGSLNPSDVDDMTDDQILGLLRGAPNVAEGPPDVYRLSPGTVAKQSIDCANMNTNITDSSEANAPNLLFARTNIPVPRVRRVIQTETFSHIIVMDYIKGPTLAEVWSTYSLWQKIRVAYILRRYVRQLRSVEAPSRTPPGPVSEQGPKECDIPSIFGQVRPTRGPFASYEELASFMNRRYDIWFRERREDDPARKQKFDDSSPLVLTHNDLNPRNIIAGEDGRLWVVDWAWSGFYPPWFEFCAMTNQVFNEELRGWHDRFWKLMVPFVCGPYFKQQLWLKKAGYGLYYK